jgi:flavorubredoxin
MGVRDLRVYDVSKTHPSQIISDAFKYSHLVLASPLTTWGCTWHGVLIRDMAALNLKDRKLALIGNGSWAPASHAIMQKMTGEMKGMELLAPRWCSAPRSSAARRMS